VQVVAILKGVAIVVLLVLSLLLRWKGFVTEEGMQGRAPSARSQLHPIASVGHRRHHHRNHTCCWDKN